MYWLRSTAFALAVHLLHSWITTPRFILKSKFVLNSQPTELFKDDSTINDIAERYLLNKFKGSADCAGDDSSEACRFQCDRSEVESLLKQILPPVSKEELVREIDLVMGKLIGSGITETEFTKAALQNSYWANAGPLVVKELIFLDCLDSFYTDGKKMLSDEDYDELKDSLTWEGSAVASLKGKEAKFISAVAAFRRGEGNMANAEYDKLKSELLSESSWVVNRVPDPLEKLGMNTFLGYMHREMSSAK